MLCQSLGQGGQEGPRYYHDTQLQWEHAKLGEVAYREERRRNMRTALAGYGAELFSLAPEIGIDKNHIRSI